MELQFYVLEDAQEPAGNPHSCTLGVHEDDHHTGDDAGEVKIEDALFHDFVAEMNGN